MKRVNGLLKHPVISISFLVTKSPRNELMPLSRQDVAILDQGQCVFLQGYLQRLLSTQLGGGCCRSRIRRSKNDRAGKRERDRAAERKTDIKKG